MSATQTLTCEEMQRYSRHFPVIGVSGQQQLKSARVLCIGAGGLGCPALAYLAAAGVGYIQIVDGDRIELSNLQRQVLFTPQDVGQYKAHVLANKLVTQNPLITVEACTVFLSSENQHLLAGAYDLVLDATDNFNARYFINAFCRERSLPLVSASIFQFDAQISVFHAHKQAPCYQCLYPEPPPKELTPNCSQAGVLGVLPGVAGTLQAMEALKVLLNLDGTLTGRLLTFNLLNQTFKTFQINRPDRCQERCCFADLPIPTVASSCDAQTNVDLITSGALQALLKSNTDIQLIDVREPYERDICHIGGRLMPLATLADHLDKLNPALHTVVYCKSGARSAQACRVLQNYGIAKVVSLEGGIIDWINTIDTTLMSY